MADTGLPSLSIPVTQGQSLYDISRIYGAGAGFGDADYIAARQAGYTDPQIVSFLKANSYLDTGNVSGAILAGQQDAIIAGGLPNINKSDPNRAALVDPNIAAAQQAAQQAAADAAAKAASDKAAADKAAAAKAATPATLPNLSDYNLNVNPYQGLKDISRVFGAGAGFGDADYIAARQAGYTDPQIVSFLKANPYLDTGNVSGAILAGQQDAIIAGGLPNLNKSDPNRAALVNPNPTSYTDPYIQKGVQGRGNDPSVQMANANVDVAGNDTYNQLMQASQAGTLVMAKAPDSRNPITGQSQPSNTYRLIDSATGNVVADSVSPTQTNGVYQFGFSNPQSEGSVNAYIRADPTTGEVGAIDPSKQLSYQAGAGGGMLSGIAQMALPVLAGLALPGIGSALGSALGLGANGLSTAGLLTSAGVDAGTAADIASGLSTASTANQIYNTANALQNGNISGAAAGLAGLAGIGGGTASPDTSAPALSNDQVGALSGLPSLSDQAGTTTYFGTDDNPTQTVTSSSNGISGPDVTSSPVTAATAPDNLPTGINTAQNGSTGTPVFQDTSGQSSVVGGTTSNYADNTKTTTNVDPNTGEVTSQSTEFNALTPTQGTAVPGTTQTNTPTSGKTSQTSTPSLSTVSKLGGIANSLINAATSPVGVAAMAGAGLASLLSNNSSSAPGSSFVPNTPAQFSWNPQAIQNVRNGVAYGQQMLSPQYYAQGGLASHAPVNSSDRYPTDEEAKEAFNAAFPTQNYTQPQTNPYVQSLQDLLVQMRLLPNNQVGVPSPESQNMAIGRGHYAHGGETYSLGSYSDGGRFLKGPGDGMSDDIPARIGHHQEARLANEEFVIPADVVSHLGNGSSEAGAQVLYKMMEKVRKARTGNPKQGKQIDPHKFMPA